MNYYKILSSNSTEETGCENFQIESIEGKYNHWGENSIRRLGYLEELNESFELNIPVLRLASNSKTTDVLCSGILRDFYQGITISSRLKALLLKHKLPKHKLYRLKLIQNLRNVNGYFRLVIYNDGLDYIDFDASKIFKYFHFEKNRDTSIKFKQSQEVRSFYKKEVINSQPLFTLKSDFLILKQGFKFDLFALGYINKGYYVSENLKTAIEESNFTGMRFEAAPEIVVED